MPGESKFKVWLRGAFRSKTIRVAVLQAVGGVVVAVLGGNPITLKIGLGMVAKSLVDAGLRNSTNESLTDKGEAATDPGTP